jgi:hypothetical protein
LPHEAVHGNFGIGSTYRHIKHRLHSV